MSKSEACQFFGASCLYLKVSKSISDVPVDQYDSLKNRLLEKLIVYASSSGSAQVRLIQRKLNATLAKLGLFLCDDQWASCVTDIIQTIPNLQVPTDGGVDKTRLVAIVVDLLTLLADEFATLTASKPKRAKVHAALIANFPLVRHFLLELFREFEAAPPAAAVDHAALALVENSLKCLNSWIEFGVQFPEVQMFVEFLFVLVYREPLFDMASECLTSLFTSEENLK